jgi:hypothetical protein
MGIYVTLYLLEKNQQPFFIADGNDSGWPAQTVREGTNSTLVKVALWVPLSKGCIVVPLLSYHSYHSSDQAVFSTFHTLHHLSLSPPLTSKRRTRLHFKPQVLARLLFFSITTMTTTGFGDVFPTQWYSRLVVTFQLLLATLYSVVILGMGLGRLRIPDPDSAKADGNSDGKKAPARAIAGAGTTNHSGSMHGNIFETGAASL